MPSHWSEEDYNVDSVTLRSQRAHLYRCKRHLAWDFCVAYHASADCGEIVAELQRLAIEIITLDMMIEEAERREWVGEAWECCMETWAGYRVL